MCSVRWLAPMALGLLLLPAVCQPGGQSAAPSSQQVSDARRAWRQVRGTWEASESWSLGPAQTAGFPGHRHDWPVNQMDRRDSLAAGAQTSELIARLTTATIGFRGIEAVRVGATGDLPQVDQLSTLRQAVADPDVNADGPLAARRVINS